MSNSSRRKGKHGEQAVRQLFEKRGWQVYPRPRGERGDDMTVISSGEYPKTYSVEVKNTKGLAYDMYAQCRRQAKKANRILAWHPSGWALPANLWVLFVWERGRPADVWVWKV